MKTFYTIVGALLIAGSSFAQTASIKNIEPAKKKALDSKVAKVQNVTIIELRSAVSCEGSTAIFCEDFEGVTAPALPEGFTTSSLESAYYIPVGESTQEVDGFYTGNATDAGAGGYWTYIDDHTQFAMTNDDACLPNNAIPAQNNNCDLNFEVLELPAVDLSNETGVWLLFDFYHDKNWGGGDAYVEASTDDGQSWTSLSEDPLPETQAWQSGAFDLSAYDGQSNLKIRFTWSDNETWASGLAVDDIVINQLPDYAMKMNNYFHRLPSSYFGGTTYQTVPLDQASVAPYFFGGYLKNMGLLDFVDAKINGSIASEGFSSESDGVNTTSLGQDTLFCNDGFVASNTGTYTAELYGYDANSVTNTETIDFNVSQFDYARDAADFTGGYTGGSYVNNEGSEQRGNVFDIYADATLYGIKVRIHPATSPNCVAKGVLNIVDTVSGDVTYLSQTADVIVGQNTDDWMNFVFDSPLQLSAGDVVLATISADFNGTDTLVIAQSGNSAQGETLLQDIDGVQGDPGVWYYTTSTAMVRLNFDPSATAPVSVTELTTEKFDIYPNPNNGLFNLEIANSQATTMTLDIHNILGQSVYSDKLTDVLNINKQIDLTHLEKGFYNVTLSSNGLSTTKKVIVQ